MHINMHCPWCESYTADVQVMRNHIEGIHQYTMAPYVFRANITRGVNRTWYIEISKLSRDTIPPDNSVLKSHHPPCMDGGICQV